jgi:hypothetical protein
MLTIEEIKKACEFAESFYLNDTSNDFGNSWSFEYKTLELPWEDFHINSGDNLNELGDYFFDVYYPLFLKKIKEGINCKYFYEGSKMFPWCITSATSYLMASNIRDDINKRVDLDPAKPDEALEEAIKYIINQMEETK